MCGSTSSGRQLLTENVRGDVVKVKIAVLVSPYLFNFSCGLVQFIYFSV